MSNLHDIIEQIELHNVDGIRKCFREGVSPNDFYNNQPLIYELISEYTRSPRFTACVNAFVEHGLEFTDKSLLAVLQDDSRSLIEMIAAQPDIIEKRYSLRCAYTPLIDATLLHICAEFNLTACAGVLVKHGADINAKAGVDEDGFGGQTPIFHTVNQNNNESYEMLCLLLSLKADLVYTVKGLIWGKSYEWETLITAVNPISYAMMGLLPAMHRNEKTIAETVTTLLKHAYAIDYTPKNIPNKYVKRGS
jgi:hypothetical protein